MRQGFCALMLAGVAALCQGAAYAAISEVVSVDTRPGVKQTFLLLEPEGTPTDIVILFLGDEGEVGFRKTADGYEIDNVGGGLTARKPMRETLRRAGFVVGVIAPPSDRNQLSSQFRKSAQHAEDIRQVIAYLRQRYSGKIYLHGHCLGSLSVASVASRLKSEGISGLILSSARSTGPAGAVTDFERGMVSVPVLLVQHRDDSCPYTPYSYVSHVKGFYAKSSPKVDLITVTGGESIVAAKHKCKNGFHGFKGAEKDTAQAITNWLQNKEFPALVAVAKQ